MPRQDEDGEAYFSYYDFDSQTGFAWNGQSNTVDVMEEGLGGRVTDTFDISQTTTALNNAHVFTVKDHAAYFVRSCREYIENRDREMPVVDFDFR